EEAERLGWKVRWWDFLFYLSFGVVITLAVPVAGVLMVFSFLVVPAVIAFLFTRDMRRLTYISWGSGALASILGLWLSLAGDLPTGPLIVCMRSEEHTSELQSRSDLVCRLLLEKKKHGRE